MGVKANGPALVGFDMYADYLVTLDIELVRKIVDRVNDQLEDAFQRLIRDGVAIDRMKAWHQTNNNDTGIFVDDRRACTVSARWEGQTVKIETTWHAPFEHLANR